MNGRLALVIASGLAIAACSGAPGDDSLGASDPLARGTATPGDGTNGGDPPPIESLTGPAANPVLILHLDDAAAPFVDTAGGSASCVGTCPAARTLGLFGSANTGYRSEAIELTNPGARSGVTTSVPIASRQCLGYPATKTHHLGDSFTLSSWFLLRAVPRPGLAMILSRYDAGAGGVHEMAFALRTKKSNGVSSVYPAFVKTPAGGAETEVLGAKLYDSSSPTAFENQWHHLVVRGTPGKVQFLVDGASAGSPSVPSGATSSSVVTQVGCAVNGSRPTGDVTTAVSDPYDSFDGKLDEIVLYDGAATDTVLDALDRAGRPAETAFGFLGNAPRDASGALLVDPLLDRLTELGASRYSFEVKKLADVADLRAVLAAIDARVAAGKDVAFWNAFQLAADARVTAYTELREHAGTLGTDIANVARDYPARFTGLHLDDFFTTSGTESLGDMDRIAPICDATMQVPSLAVSAVVYCDYPFDAANAAYGPSGWLAGKPAYDHLAFRDYAKYLKSTYMGGKYASCLGGANLYTSFDQRKDAVGAANFVTDNAQMIDACIRDLRPAGLPVTEGMYTSATASHAATLAELQANLAVARKTTPDAFEAFTLPIDASTGAAASGSMFGALAAAYADKPHFILW